MLPLLLYLAALTHGPHLDRLGHDNWSVREAEHGRLNNFLSALLLPTSHADPEINYRIRAIRTRHLKWIDRRYLERLVYREDFDAWLRVYLVPGVSAIAEEWDTFADIHLDQDKGLSAYRSLPCAPDDDGPFIIGVIYPGEYERWLARLDYHQGRAPMPREVRPSE